MFDMAKVKYNWFEVQRFHDDGHGPFACCERFGFTLGAWYKAIRSGRLRPNPTPVIRYDWSAVQAYYNEGHSYRECMLKFGFTTASWAKSVKAGRVAPRPQRMPLELILKSKSRSSIKRRLLDAGILKNVCDECGISEWRGKRLSIQIDHVNGVRDDHRLENLRMLCPNCHSQTETFAARNRLRPKLKLA
jgi:hypothetical protein